MPFTVLDPTTAAAAPTTSAGEPLTSVGETLASFKENLVDDLQGRLDISDTRLDRWFNKSYLSLCAMLDINELSTSVGITLVADQPLYLVPENLAWIKWIGVEDSTHFLDGGRGFEMIDEMTYRTLPDSSSLTGVPNFIRPFKYFRHVRMIVLYPTPDSSLVAAMDFRVRPAKLVDATDSPILPEEFHETLFEMSKARALRGLGQRSEGDRVFNDAISLLRPILDTDAQEKDSMHMVMQPVRSRNQLYRSHR